MFKPYCPCDDCKQPREICSRCGYKALETNYHRALVKIVELSHELGKQITILV